MPEKQPSSGKNRGQGPGQGRAVDYWDQSPRDHGATTVLQDPEGSVKSAVGKVQGADTETY